MMLLISMMRNWLIHDNTGRYWLVFGGDGSIWGGTGWYLVVLGQNRAVRVDIRCYWVIMKRNWLIRDNTRRC